MSAVPHGRWERLTILGGLSLAGLVACLAVEGATDTAVMLAFVEHALVPVLRPGQTVILDNLSVHRDARVRRRIEAAGCRLLFLPPALPAPVLARLQSHRAHVEQTQDAPARRGRPHDQRPPRRAHHTGRFHHAE